MRRLLFVLGTVVVTATLLTAAGPVGSVTSSTSFLLSGHAVPVDGIPQWPVMVGDNITTSSAGAFLQFQNGAKVSLSANSTGKIEQSNGVLVFRLQSGSAAFSAPSNGKLSFFVVNTPVPVSAKVGTDTVVYATSRLGAASKDEAFSAPTTTTTASAYAPVGTSTPKVASATVVPTSSTAAATKAPTTTTTAAATTTTVIPTAVTANPAVATIATAATTPTVATLTTAGTTPTVSTIKTAATTPVVTAAAPSTVTTAATGPVRPLSRR